MKSYDIVVIGGGPAGLAAAAAAKRSGLHTFKEELTGPEYAHRFIEQVQELNIEYCLNTMVIDISHEKVVTAMNREEGLFEIQAKAVILMLLQGCVGAQAVQHSVREAFTIITYGNLILLLHNTDINGNGAAVGIVANAVADQIFKHTLQ